MNILKWTPELSERFWRDLGGSEFLANIAFSRFAAPFLVDLVEKHLKREGSILDFGAGHNLYLVRELLSRGLRVGYYEPNVAPDRNPQNLECTDGSFLGAVSELEPDKYDCVFFSEVIEHLFDDQRPGVMTALARTLKPGGILIVTTPDQEDLMGAARYCPICKHLFHPWGHVRSFSPNELEALLSDYGLRCEELHSVDFSETREPLEELKELKRRIAGMVAELRGLQQQKSVFVAPNVTRALGKYIELFGDIGGLDAAEDPKHRHIGFGGTLVAVARKHEISE